MPIGTKGEAELAELMGKAQLVYQTIVEVQQNITHIINTLSPIRGFSLIGVCEQTMYAVAE